jgi:hypothetical protein
VPVRFKGVFRHGGLFPELEVFAIVALQPPQLPVGRTAAFLVLRDTGIQQALQHRLVQL